MRNSRGKFMTQTSSALGQRARNNNSAWRQTTEELAQSSSAAAEDICTDCGVVAGGVKTSEELNAPVQEGNP